MEKDNNKCPTCGEEENLHFNYDYSKKELPVTNVLCNECGTYFVKNEKDYTKKRTRDLS